MLALSSLLLLRPVPLSFADTATATASAQAGITVEPLFTTVLPAAALPIAPITDFLLWRATIDPGVTVVFPPGYGACCPGPVLTHVLEGELTLRVEGPHQIVRASTMATPRPAEAGAPGTAVTLPARGLSNHRLCRANASPPLPPGAVTVELVRVHMPPGTELAATPVGALRLAIRESGAEILERRPDGTLGNIGRTALVVDVLTLFPHSGAGTLMPVP